MSNSRSNNGSISAALPPTQVARFFKTVDVVHDQHPIHRLFTAIKETNLEAIKRIIQSSTKPQNLLTMQLSDQEHLTTIGMPKVTAIQFAMQQLNKKAQTAMMDAAPNEDIKNLLRQQQIDHGEYITSKRRALITELISCIDSYPSDKKDLRPQIKRLLNEHKWLPTYKTTITIEDNKTLQDITPFQYTLWKSKKEILDLFAAKLSLNEALEQTKFYREIPFRNRVKPTANSAAYNPNLPPYIREHGFYVVSETHDNDGPQENTSWDKIVINEWLHELNCRECELHSERDLHKEEEITPRRKDSDPNDDEPLLFEMDEPLRPEIKI